MLGNLRSSMVRLGADDGWWLPGLGASGPAPSLRRELELFGQFVGGWEIFAPESRRGGTRGPAPSGEVHFRWVLGGTAIQDIWGRLDVRTRRLIPQGSTLRFYDPDRGLWRSTWISPVQGEVRQFLGRKVGEEIVLKEQDRRGDGERWVFSEIEPRSFGWRAESPSEGRGRRITEEYRIRRKPG